MSSRRAGMSPLPSSAWAGLAGEDADHAVRVAYAGHFRIGDHHGFVGEVGGHQSAFFNAGRAVADDVIHFHVFAQCAEHAFHAFLAQGILVAGLGGGQDEQVIHLLVLDHRLFDIGIAIDHIDQVIDHAALATHDQVQVAQAHVKIDDGGFETAQGQDRLPVQCWWWFYRHHPCRMSRPRFSSRFISLPSLP